MNTRRFLLAALAASALLSGCAALKTVSADVRSFGEWPAGRAVGSYAFERLPSQQQQPARAAEWEALAAPALAKAGFRPAAAGTQADVIVSIGARVSAQAPNPFDDPFWYRWHGGYWRQGLSPLRGYPFYPGYPDRRYEREVGVLLRDRASGQPLFEARASSDGFNRGDDALMQTLFIAALADFPAAQPKAHEVRVPLP